MTGRRAIVIDTGFLYQERAELQNGADAGALAVAQGCATGASTCMVDVFAARVAKAKELPLL